MENVSSMHAHVCGHMHMYEALLLSKFQLHHKGHFMNNLKSDHNEGLMHRHVT